MFNLDFMTEAIKEAEKALKKQNIPIGCVIVFKNKIIARSHNQNFWHAEIIAIQKAQKILGKYLNNCQIFCTAKPCTMCEHALKLARVEKIIYGTKINYPTKQPQIIGSIKEKKCGSLIKNFFNEKRK